MCISGTEEEQRLQRLRALQQIRRNVAISQRLSSIASPWRELQELQHTFWTSDHHLPTCVDKEQLLRYDFAEVAAAWERQDVASRKELAESLVNYRIKLFLPTVEYPQGAMCATSDKGRSAILWESGYYETVQVHAEQGIPAAVCCLRMWLTLLCCPERCHATVCKLFSPVFCMCDKIKRVKF